MTGAQSPIDGIDPDPTPLPPAVSETVADLFGLADPPATTVEWAAAIRERLSADLDRDLGVGDLCHADRETPHVARTAGETHRFLCPVDGVVLARLAGSATVETECPSSGRRIELAVDGDDMAVTPGEAVFSLGIDADPEVPEDAPTPALAYGAVCPHVRGFSDRGAYSEWAADHDAPTVAVSPAETLRVAGAMVGE